MHPIWCKKHASVMEPLVLQEVEKGNVSLRKFKSVTMELLEEVMD